MSLYKKISELINELDNNTNELKKKIPELKYTKNITSGYAMCASDISFRLKEILREHGDINEYSWTN